MSASLVLNFLGGDSLFNLSIPCVERVIRILSLGPSFELIGQLKAALDLDLNVTVGLNYNITDATLAFPPGNTRKSGGDFKPADSSMPFLTNWTRS
jgi:hypothetical protein